MKIGIIGASGKAGNFIKREALDRGNVVTSIVRDEGKLTGKSDFIIEKDIFDLQTEDIKDLDVLVNAFGVREPGKEHQHAEAGRVLMDIVKGAPETRLVVVGGAGSLFVDKEKTTTLMETADFPKEAYPTSVNQGKNLKELKQSSGINWVFISPGAVFDPEGQRTGSYQKGKDMLITNKKGESYISYADYAIAVLDEIETPVHDNERFAVVAEAE
ncbi:NAD(P)-dependent oxidoreductase [Virgibacillus sp. NKC19-3]|uniref:NAD(P)-dependent oxidoreductase n=1 Tax=Virgibacillus saliphilus TaxID=2831674 RepID=UPI001C9AA98F|nr:NAD(P)-dependent oxidoreductase [Virgibacillus sp. NKC19-3]MBY7142122.1 NAD(P)-dependent oxidoreductase [Virgibacillus sp. NKC19-3]